jgi:hypothetical protein
MSYRSEIKKAIEKHYPQYKIETILTSDLQGKGIIDSNSKCVQITAELKKKKEVVLKKPKKVRSLIPPHYGANESPEPYYHGESIATIERREGHGFWGNASSGYITDEQERNMP